MTTVPPLLADAITARQAGRRDDALRLLENLFAQACDTQAPFGYGHFMAFAFWRLVAEDDADARARLAARRDEVARLVLERGDDPALDRGWAYSRFRFCVHADEELDNRTATHALFAALEARQPALAQRVAWHALPAVVAAGDFALAARHLPDDPLPRLAALDGLPEPRRSAECSNVMRDVRLRADILDSLGRRDEAAALRSAAQRYQSQRTSPDTDRCA